MNDGGSAFPTPEIRDGEGNGIQQASDGMTLRDYFAAKVLPRLTGVRIAVGSPGWQEDAARNAYSVADAMLRERAQDRSAP